MRRRTVGLAELVPGGLVVGGVGLIVFAATFVSKDPAWATTVGCGGAAAFVSGVGLLKARRSWRTNASLVVVVVSGGILLLEGALSLRACGYAEAPRPDFDRRTPLEVVRDLRAEGVGAVPALLPTYLKHRAVDPMPLGGVSTATTVFCNESGRYVIYSSDEHGFNNVDGHPVSADVVLIGDSFAHGQCVEPGDDLAARLRTRGYRSVNLGMAGNGPLTELATLTEYGLRLRPRVVVWLYYDNDVGDLAAELRSDSLRRYLEPSHTQSLVNRQAEIDQVWHEYLAEVPDPAYRQRAGWKEQFGRIARLANTRRLLGLRRATAGSLVAELTDVFREAERRTRSHGARLVVVALPSYARVRSMTVDKKLDVFRAAEAVGIVALDFAEHMSSVERWDRFYVDGRPSHFTPWGYARLASEIDALIQRIDIEMSTSSTASSSSEIR